MDTYLLSPIRKSSSVRTAYYTFKTVNNVYTHIHTRTVHFPDGNGSHCIFILCFADTYLHFVKISGNIHSGLERQRRL